MFLRAALLSTALIGVSLPAFAANVVVSQYPWNRNQAFNNMGDVFGTNFTSYDSYASADAGSIFSKTNSFVYLTGGAGTDTALNGYLGANGASILGWVSSGGHLLVQSAGWNGLSINLGVGTLTQDGSHYNGSGTLTEAGKTAFSFFPTPANQSGGYLAHDVISGTGLTTYMTGDQTGDAIIAGAGYGHGFIMYSGLTDSEFHAAGNGLVDNTIAFTASATGLSAVPLPASAPMFGAALLVLGAAGYGVKRKKAAATA